MPDQAVGVLFLWEGIMPLLADKTITVYNLRYDPETDTEAEISTILTGVSVHQRTVANAAADGLNAASVSQIRIFAGRTRAATQSVRGTLAYADSKYLAPSEWSAKGAAAAADAWTLRPGDIVEYNGQRMTILAVHDNRSGRINPHWYVEAH